MTRCWPVLLALGAILTLPGVPPPLAAGPTREEALTALADGGDVDNRRRGVLALGETGLMTDLPQLAAALRDADRLVQHCERGGPPIARPPQETVARHSSNVTHLEAHEGSRLGA